MLPVLLVLALHAQDPVVVRARLQDEAIRAGETTVLRVDVETGGPRAQIGSFGSLPPGLEVLGTRSFDQRQFSMPGGTRRFISREFVLRVRAAGRYRVPSIDVTVEGRAYSTQTQLLTVMAPSTPSGEPSEDQEGVVLRAWLDADTVTVGEQVTLEAEAMFSPDARLRLRRAPEYDAPSPSGFWVHDLPDRQRSSTRFVGQERYEVQRFSRILFPLAPGEYEIPPARLEYEMRRGLLYAPETRYLETDALRLVVRPVPEPRPAGFTGAVGRFTVRGGLEPAEVPAGEAAVLTVEVEGEGNVKALPAPELPDIDGIDAFPPSEEAETDTREGVLRGTKRFSWVLIPRQAGEIEIPEIRYAYYDPDAGRFDVAVLDPLRLNVSAGASTRDGPVAPALRYLEVVPGQGRGLAWVRSPWFAALQLLPLLAFFGVFGWRRGARRGGQNRRRLRRERRAQLKALEARVDAEGAGLYADAEAFTRSWLARRLRVPAAQTARPSVLLAAGVPEETARALRGLMDRLAAGRYAPTPPDPEVRRETIRALARLLDRLDRETPFSSGTPHRAPGPAAVGVIVALLVPGVGSAAASPMGGLPQESAGTQGPAAESRDAAGPGRTPDTTGDSFAAGIEAFDAERYADAVSAFQRHLAAHPDDAAGWYNLGTAYFRGGFDGYAIWAWLKTVRLDPRHEDARHNLRVAGAAPELVARVGPLLRVRGEEFLLLASMAWLITGLAGTVWLLRRRRRAIVAAGVSLVLALLLAGAGWASTHPARTLIVLRETPLRVGPNLGADPLSTLEPGVGLAPVEARGEWVRVRTAGGADGWIETTATESL